MIFFSKKPVSASKLRHFVLISGAPIDPNQLRDLVTLHDRDYSGCDIYDLRGYPAEGKDHMGASFEDMISALIRLRFTSSEWVARRKAVVILPFKQTKAIDLALAQMRAVGLLGVVVAESDAVVDQARALSPNLEDEQVLRVR